MPARRSLSPSINRPSAQIYLPGQPVSAVKVMRSSLCACCTPAALRFSRIMAAKSSGVAAPLWRYRRPGSATPSISRSSIDRDGTMRREALDRERSGHAHARTVSVRLVVEILELRLGGDRGVDFLLPGDPRLPPFAVRVLRSRGPLVLRLAGNFPFLPGFRERLVERGAQRLQRRLPLLPDHVDLGIVGNRAGSAGPRPFIDEPLANISVRRC